MAKKRSSERKYEANVLSFKRINNCSDGLFYEKSHTSEEVILKVKEVGVRGPIETRPDNPVRPPKDYLNPNPQTVEVCKLQNDMDTLVVKYYLQPADTPAPYSCDNPLVQDALTRMHEEFIEEGIYDRVAERIATNIANARSLWMNRLGCKDIKVTVELMNGREHSEDTWEFDALSIPLDFKKKIPEKELEKIKGLASELAEVYKGKAPYKNFKVTMEAVKFFGMEVRPSQEMPASRNYSRSGEPSKVLYKINDQAAFHPQKITNALFCIDDWYPGTEEVKEPISVNVFGTISQEGFAGREPQTRKDFYNLFDAAKDEMCRRIEDGEEPKVTCIEPEDKYFLAAMMLRGGVFAKSGKDAAGNE